MVAVGPWSEGGDVFIALVPIIVLLALVLKPKPAPATFSLPVSAAVLWVLRLVYFHTNANLVNAATLQGIFNCITPVSIGLGAICLFESMEKTYCLEWLIQLMKKLSNGNPIAQIMIIGWGFIYLVEGAAGFGTPVALAAPILASIGFDPIPVACLCLAMDGLETTFGAVGTPMFFGFSPIIDDGSFTDDELVDSAIRIAVINWIASLFVPLMALNLIFPWSEIKPSLGFIWLSVCSCSLTAVAFSSFSYNLPSLLGGVIGLAITMLLSNYQVMLHPARTRLQLKQEKEEDIQYARLDEENVLRPTEAEKARIRHSQDIEAEEHAALLKSQGTNGDMDLRKKSTESFEEVIKNVEDGVSLYDVLANTFPIWGTVVLLILTRVQEIGLTDPLQATDPHVTISLGTLGDLQIAAPINLTWTNILRQPDAPSWNFAVLFVPWFIPFIVVATATMVLHRHRLDPGVKMYTPFMEGLRRMKNPTIALAGATCLAALLTAGGDEAPARQLGTVVSNALQEGWVALTVFLGALGAFFAGSTTVSNLTFGSVQLAAAENLGLSPSGMIALQAVGGNIGNMIALGNIVLVKAIMGTVKDVPEGVFVRINLKIAGAYLLCATACGFVLLFAIDPRT